MQGRVIGQGRIWLLAGTGEGPPLAAALLRIGWRVEGSVVTPSAARPYAGLDLDRMAVGSLQGEKAIEAVLNNGAGFRWVIDVTHPFAVRISADLARTCARSASLCCACNGRWSRAGQCSCWIGSVTCGGSISAVDVCCWPWVGGIFPLCIAML